MSVLAIQVAFGTAAASQRVKHITTLKFCSTHRLLQPLPIISYNGSAKRSLTFFKLVKLTEFHKDNVGQQDNGITLIRVPFICKQKSLSFVRSVCDTRSKYHS